MEDKSILLTKNNKNLLVNKNRLLNKIIKINKINYKYFSCYTEKLLIINSKLIIYRFLFSLFLFLFSYFLYYLSLEKCMEGQVECSRKNKWIKTKLAEAISSSFIISFLLELMIFNIISKLHLIHIFLVFFSFFIYSHGLEFYDHGLFNFLGFIIILIIIFLVLLPFNFLLYLLKKKNKLLIFIYLVFLIFFLFFYYYKISYFLGCKDWEKGLNNTFIENNEDKYGCQIKLPKYCPYKFGKYFLDITKKSGVKCGKEINAKTNLLKFSTSKYINIHTKKIGFPLLTNKDYIYLNLKNNNNNFTLKTFTKDNLIDMDNKLQLTKLGKKNKPEVIIDFSKNPYGEMIINVNYNESLSKERKKKEKNVNPYSNNILILYFDSVSRSSGIRQLKKTLKFIEGFMPYKGKYNKKFPSENFHSFQFFKYHSFLHYTSGNYPKLFYRTDKSNNMTRITKYLKENGYITGFSNDMCMRDPCQIQHNISQDEICDHEFIICDPNKKSTNSMIKKCLYDKVNAGHQYEYGLQFWRKYKNNRRFLLIVNNDGHEGTLEILKYDDDIIFNFLNILYNENNLKETSIMLLSDHGCPMPSIYFFNVFFRMERNLPMLYLIIPDKKNSTYNKQYKYIYENQQKLITAYDIYNTIVYLIYGNDYKKKNVPKLLLGKNLFSQISSKRTPDLYQNMSIKTCLTLNKKSN